MNKEKGRFGLLLFLILFTFASCNKKRADKIFYNGNVYLVNGNFSVVEAFAIQKGRIREVGTNSDILDDFQSDNIIDLKGASVFPGFIDAHCHFYGYATDRMKCDLYRTESFDDVISRVIEFSKTNQFEWILGRGWDQNDWQDKTFPDKQKLDSLFRDIPVFLSRIDGHAVLCNQKALDLSGISASTKVDGGEILLTNGLPNGILIDNAVDLVKKKIPAFPPSLVEKAILIAQDDCFAVGLTTVDDAGLGKDSIFKLLEMQKSGQLKMRIYAMISDDPATIDYFFDHGIYKDERMSVRALKVYADGSLGSRGACMKKEYSDQKGHFGYMLHSTAYFDKMAEEALSHGFQLCTHAIGDSANKMINKVYDNHLSSENHHRWRIEHCQVVDPKERKMMGDNSVIPSVQPTHATSDMYWAEERLGKDRMDKAYAYKEIMNYCEGMIAFGTDFPVENINPIYTFYAAVVRKDLKGQPKDGFQIDNKIDRKNALKAMTINAAFANFEEEEKGSIEEGKYADFVILNKNLMKVDDEDIPKVKVMATYVNGEKVFERIK